jgi:phage-related protein
MKEVVFYKLPSGKSPIEVFLDGLSSKEAQKVTWVLTLIEEMEQVSTKYYKQLSNADGIIEIRVQIGKNHFRLLGFEHKGLFVVLTNGFKKKDQKVPKSEIALAQSRRKEYLDNE